MWLNENMSQITNDVQPHPSHKSSAEPALIATSTRPLSRGEQLANRIRESISACKMAAGDFFGTLESIREETGYARTTVSDAVNLLRDR